MIVNYKSRLHSIIQKFKDKEEYFAFKDIQGGLEAIQKAVESIPSTVSGTIPPGSVVPPTRNINTTLPLTGGGSLAADLTLDVNNFTGDSGAGGLKGTVPAPIIGDATKYLKGDGTWSTVVSFTAGGDLSGSSTSQSVIGIQSHLINGGPTDGYLLKYSSISGKWEPTLVTAEVPLLVGFIVPGRVGNNVGPSLVAPRTGSLSKCVVVVHTSDPLVDLTFRIKKNGVNIFSVDPTIAAGTSSGTISTFTTLTSVPLGVTENDLFTIDVTSGTTTWQFTAQLEGIAVTSGSGYASLVSPVFTGTPQGPAFWTPAVLSESITAPTDCVATVTGSSFEIASGVLLDLSSSTGLTCLEIA